MRKQTRDTQRVTVMSSKNDDNILSYHPSTNKHYIHIIQPVPAFLDVYNSYKRLSKEYEWLSVIKQDDYLQSFDKYDKENNVIILWHDQEVPKKRKAKIIIRYSEMVGNIDTFDDQKNMLNQFINRIDSYDAIIVHSLTARDYIKAYKKEVEYIPIGYDPHIYGKPENKTLKEHDLVFYGSPVGRRVEIIKYLKNHFKDRLHITCLFGEQRQALLNKSRINLIIPWCKNGSFAMFRLLQCLGSSAAMLTEKQDTYPAIANEHIIQITDFDNKIQTINEIELALTQDLLSIASKAYTDLSKISTTQCMNMLIDYLTNLGI